MANRRPDTERQRLDEARNRVPWRKWGPYLSERQWGTVREDYSDSGDAWSYFTHDQARSRAYRWGEDGIAGICDDKQLVCFAVAMWNGKDPILKERLFGLSNSEGNHGEDVKEHYFYLDSTPTHSYMKYLYKYPQAAFPYDDLVRVNRQRGPREPEYELLDTGVFDGDRYFDVFVEYAKAAPEDILIRITVANRGPEAAELHLLPTVWFRNTWSSSEGVQRPLLRRIESAKEVEAIEISHPHLGSRTLVAESAPTLLFTENESNSARLVHSPNATPYVKDGINDFVVQGRKDAVNPDMKGTKAAAHYALRVEAGASHIVQLRLTDTAPQATKGPPGRQFGREFDELFQARQGEADEFYDTVIPPALSDDEANVMRQAFAGMLWSKQFYRYDVYRWLEEHGAGPFSGSQREMRNSHWHHMDNADVFSMPDKWEYPWFAAWDLAFHSLPLALVDEDFGKQQLELLLGQRYLNPNGQIPAYEWNFGDVNPPVHAWSTIFAYRLERLRTGKADREWLQRCFEKLLLNFTWWVNRKDRFGNNAFEGGFLGLDNISVFDRSTALPTGGYLEQADGTAWMALFSQSMLEIACELAMGSPGYEEMCLKFIEHFLWIGASIMHAGDGTGMWDEEDGFFYDVLRLPDGRSQRLKVRSMVGLLPLCAVTYFDGSVLANLPERRQMLPFLERRPELRAFIHDPLQIGKADRRLAAVLNETNLRRVLSVVLDEDEFLSPFGIRSLSRRHVDHPFVVSAGGETYAVSYEPAESDSRLFGGNSNWRGPIWMPVNTMIIRALLQYFSYYGDGLTVECPTGSGTKLNLFEVAREIAQRLTSIFTRKTDGTRPVYGGQRKFQQDPHWRDSILFHEYFHGDNGAGLGAGHQTGWTGLIAPLMHLFATCSAQQYLDLGKEGSTTSPQVPRRDARVARI